MDQSITLVILAYKPEGACYVNQIRLIPTLSQQVFSILLHALSFLEHRTYGLMSHKKGHYGKVSCSKTQVPKMGLTNTHSADQKPELESSALDCSAKACHTKQQHIILLIYQHLHAIYFRQFINP